MCVSLWRGYSNLIDTDLFGRGFVGVSGLVHEARYELVDSADASSLVVIQIRFPTQVPLVWGQFWSEACIFVLLHTETPVSGFRHFRINKSLPLKFKGRATHIVSL
jgi:hypothetical protein